MLCTSDCDYSHICRLIDDSLCQYTLKPLSYDFQESEAVSLTKEKEKDLLIALSQVLKQIKLWTQEAEHNSKHDSVTKRADDEKWPAGSEPNDKEHHCLTKIIVHLMVLLNADSHYVQHLAGNMLVATSEFLLASGEHWDFFISILCGCIEFAIVNTVSSSSAPSSTKADLSNFATPSDINVFKSRLKEIGWSTVACTFRVLRNIWKYLREEYDDQFVEVYLNAVNSSLLNIPWDVLDDIHFGLDSIAQKSSCLDTLYRRKIVWPDSKVVFLGHFVQFLSSLVETSESGAGFEASSGEHPVILKITSLAPKLLCWCLGKQGDYVNASISQYFRHKILVLMIRLSFQNPLECAVLVSWLQLLNAHFQGLLRLPINQLESGRPDCLDGSPFLLSDPDGDTHGISFHHLQRLVVFLFLRCSYSLISLKVDSDKPCTHTTLKSSFLRGSVSDLESSCREKGLLELNKWFHGHFPIDMLAHPVIYAEKCTSFASSFLRLFIDEDDLLFKVLLQLLSLQCVAVQQFPKGKNMLQDAKKDILVHVSNFFNPVHLFHMFLAELHYDHQLLLDYLISKDMGIISAEYLLRSLRSVCDSWDLFLEFSMGEEVKDQLSSKKRKVLLWDSSQAALSPSPVKCILPSLEEECQTEHHCGCRQSRIGQPFKKAKDCLLSLKSSLGNLYQKNLFPYNPKVLLKRYSFSVVINWASTLRFKLEETVVTFPELAQLFRNLIQLIFPASSDHDQTKSVEGVRFRHLFDEDGLLRRTADIDMTRKSSSRVL